MANKLRPWIVITALMAIFASLGILESATALGCWPRLLAARQPCTPIVVEASMPIQPKEAVKEAPIPAVDKDLRVNVKNLAILFKQGNTTGATKFAQLVAPMIQEIGDLEGLYRPRNKGGLGWGSKPGVNPATDGLERFFFNLPKNAPMAVAMKLNNEEAAFWIAALAELSIAKAPKKDRPNGKTTKLWLDSAIQLRAASLDFAYPAAMGDLNHMKELTPRILAACNACHAKFKE